MRVRIEDRGKYVVFSSPNGYVDFMPALTEDENAAIDRLVISLRGMGHEIMTFDCRNERTH